eukprot:TRINITY_DN8126_c0_g1_i2.p1 TRINITY_DN8126_c0_g1~~TRINITY_DN8126_c0_g1_i2.p1  ORF type:complete len:295 (+),score=46.00 TRINITY_DN8126_c0_g1_i2:56-940(+)
MIRTASHAGSWYTDDGQRLSRQLQTWLREAGEAESQPVRAIIAPHAGYSYSGPTAAFAYKELIPDNIKRIFILGPSHHVYLPGCALTEQDVYETPIGNLTIDRTINDELSATGQFETMSKAVDEDEHSIEMHLPYVAELVRDHDVTVVPILVGALNKDGEARYGRLLAPYLRDESNFFIISSDFCHWGRRFQYQPGTNAPNGDIFKHIEALDREGMKLIEEQKTDEFHDYLKRTRNTICGRHPISVLLHGLDAVRNDHDIQIRFLRYAQSSAVRSKSDSSVSYASAAVTIAKSS